METLQSIAKALIASGKGILAADESTGTIQKRFDKIGVENTEENRREYRELLFTTPGMEQYISGVILFDETLRQKAANGVPFVDVLNEAGVIPGIKVDKGTESITEGSAELVTKGIDGLGDRMKEYYALGARFAKWRGVFAIGDGIPSDTAIQKNAELLAEYAKICQDNNVVPIVEPEVLMDGTNTDEVCLDVTRGVLKTVFAELKKKRVALDGMLLKPNMIVPGKKSGQAMTPERVADMTLRCLNETVPHGVPGIVFLSGGQSEAEASANLNEMNKRGPHPWAVSYSYGRALQGSALEAWAGKKDQTADAQKAFLKRSRLVSAAQKGEYSADME